MTVPSVVAEERKTRKKPLYAMLWVQVLAGIIIGVVLGFISPAAGAAMKPLGDAFIKLITMVITLLIFCTVVSGIAGMQDMKKVGRVGGKALLYFEVVSTLALLLGLLVGNLVRPGSGFNINPASLDVRAVSSYAGQSRAQSTTDFLMNIIPHTVVDAFARGDILEVLFVALLFGFALSMAGTRCRPLIDLIESLTHGVFSVVDIIMRFAPIGAFGAMAFTIGKYGIASLEPLAKLIITFYITCILLHSQQRLGCAELF
jgi:aerobic C4-dicarboxylate transport protein